MDEPIKHPIKSYHSILYRDFNDDITQIIGLTKEGFLGIKNEFPSYQEAKKFITDFPDKLNGEREYVIMEVFEKNKQ